MAAKTSLAVLGGTLSLVAFLVWRAADDPTAPVRQPIGSETTAALAPADLAPVDAAPGLADDGAREAVATPDEAPSGRVWPGTTLPGPGRVFALTGQVVDENDLPVPGAEVYLGPLGHPLNQVATADDGGRFRVQWHARGATLNAAFCAKGENGPGPLQRLRLTAGENVARTTVANRGLVAVTVSFAEFGEEGDWAVAMRTEQALKDAQTEASVAGLPLMMVRAHEMESGPLDRAPTALVDEDGFLHFVGLDDPTGCPAGLLDYMEDVLLSEAVVLQGQLDLAAAAWAETQVIEYEEYAADFLLAETTAGENLVEVRGVVFDGGGEPVAGALVAHLHESGKALETTTTGEDGTFLLENLLPGDLRLRAGGGNHGLALASFTAGAGQGLRWEPILERGREIRGRLVTDAGEALAHWRVVALAQDESARWSDLTATDEDGFFAVPNCPEQGMRLCFSDPEAEGPFPNLVVEDVWPDTTPEPFVVPANALRRGVFEVTVVNASGEPLTEALVRIWHRASGTGAWVESENEEGLFRLEGLPPTEYRVEIGTSRHGWIELPGVWLAAGDKADLGVVALPEPGHLAFEVAAGGRDGFDDLRVEIWSERHDVRNRVRSIDGVVPPALLLPEGDYVATARSRDGASTVPFSLAGSGYGALALDLRNGQTALSPTELDAARFEERLGEIDMTSSCANCHSSETVR